MITEQMITEQIELYEYYNTELIEIENLSVYVNREVGTDGTVFSAYIGLEDENGRAITGYDEPVLPF